MRSSSGARAQDILALLTLTLNDGHSLTLNEGSVGSGYMLLTEIHRVIWNFENGSAGVGG